LSNEDADRMIAAQMPAERKRAQSEFTIENERSLKTLERKARSVFDELRRRAATAALGRPARALLLVARPSHPNHPALTAIGHPVGLTEVSRSGNLRRDHDEHPVRAALQRRS